MAFKSIHSNLYHNTMLQISKLFLTCAVLMALLSFKPNTELSEDELLIRSLSEAMNAVANPTQDNPRGLILCPDGKLKWELEVQTMSKIPNEFVLKIVREKDGKSRLVYSSLIYLIDKGAEGYSVKITLGKEGAGSWEPDRRSWLKATYKSDTDYSYEIEGAMKSMEFNKYKLTDAQISEKCKPNTTKFKTVRGRYTEATCCYLVYKYGKALKFSHL